MHFMYVDESGDPGQLDPSKPPEQQPSPHYILSGFIIPDREWRNYLTAMVDIRRQIKSTYGLAARAELHRAELLGRTRTADYKAITKRQRAEVYRFALSQVAARMTGAKIINLHLNKASPKYASNRNLTDIQGRAWDWLLQRFHTHLTKVNDFGMVIADDTNEPKLRKLLRKMRAFNPVPSQFGTGTLSRPVERIIEDPVMRRSEHSFYVQIADLTAHALYRRLYPKGSLKQFRAERLFDLLRPLLHLPACRTDPLGMGIVTL